MDHYCPMCGQYLLVQVAVGGKAPGSSYVRVLPFCLYLLPAFAKISYFQCENVAQHFTKTAHFFRLPPANTSTSGMSQSSAAIPLSSTAPPSGSSLATTPTCAKTKCSVRRLDGGCSRRMCRKHCVAEGPCALLAHETFRRQSAAKGAGTEPAFTALDNGRPFTSFFAMHQDVMSPLKALENWQVREDARKAAEGRQLDLAVGLKSPSPDVPLEVALRRQEDADLALALHLSQETSEGSLHSLRSLSLSPDFPESLSPQPPSTLSLGRAAAPNAIGGPSSIPHASATPALGRASAPNVTGGHTAPRKRIPASSVHHRPRPLPLNITTQMNEVWMGSNGGPDVQGQPPSSTFHIKQGSSRRPFTDPRTVERIIVVYFDEDGVAHTFFIERCLHWPTWRVSEATGVFAVLLADVSVLDLYTPKYKTWITIGADFVHQVTTDCVIMLRKRGVRCIDEDKVIESFYPTTAPPHLRYNLPAERTAVRKEHTRRKATSATAAGLGHKSDDESDEEIEVVHEVRKNKRALKEVEDASFLPPRQRPRLSITTDVIVVDDDSPPPTTTSSVFSTASALASTSSAATTPASSPHPASAPLAPLAPWPAGLYVVDMA
ncbi:hypothetical protein DFH09DRAFT_1295913 [Mycena vulgaris]|nr:hypothetical protein DFH09DRAFT_1295913 [Mycena vulgaris]